MTSQPRTTLDPNWQAAVWLASFTILYNFAEGIISIFFGADDETITLLGFGLDSLVEVISGIGILAMVLRIQRNSSQPVTQFEKSALRATGFSFFLLAVGLGATAVINMVSGHQPTTTLPGLIISVVSIAVMWALVREKRRVGHALASAPILADANCTMVCVYMSFVLLAASLIYQSTGFGFVDSLGAFGLIWFSVREGKEALEKARNIDPIAV